MSNVTLNNRGHKFVLNGREYLVSATMANKAPILAEKTINSNGTYIAENDPYIVTQSLGNFTVTSSSSDGTWHKITSPIDLTNITTITLHLKIVYTSVDDDLTVTAPIQAYTGGIPYDYTRNIRNFSLSRYALVAIDGNDLYFGVGSGEYQFTDVVVETETEINGYSKIIIQVPQSGATIRYLVHGHCDTDNGEANVNKPLTLDTFDDFSDYLTYSTGNKQFVVKKDFEAILVPWVVNYQRGTYPAEVGLKINNNWVVQFNSLNNNVGSIGGIATSYTNDSALPTISNGLYISLHVDDTIAMQKPVDHGWAEFHLKIYKVFDSSTDTDTFMNSVVTLDNTSLYKTLEIH